MKEKLMHWMKTAPKMSHTIRVLAGGYLMYLSYGMFTDPASEITAFVVLCGILFAVIGLFFLATSLIALNKGYYSDYVDMNALSDDEAEETQEDQSDIQT